MSRASLLMIGVGLLLLGSLSGCLPGYLRMDISAPQGLIMMMAAGSLFGFFGILFAVPLGAILKIAIVRFTRYYLKTDFYLKENT